MPDIDESAVLRQEVSKNLRKARNRTSKDAILLNRVAHFGHEVPHDHANAIKQAFGRNRQADSKLANEYLDQARNGNIWFGCDCRPDAIEAPLLCVVEGRGLRRMEQGERTPHAVVGCPFYRTAADHRLRKRAYAKPDHPPDLLLHRNFGGGENRDPNAERRTVNSDRDKKPDSLQVILWEWLSAADLNVIRGDEINDRGEDLLQSQQDRLDEVIGGRYLCPGRHGLPGVPLAEVFSFDPASAVSFAIGLKTRQWPQGVRPQGFLTGIVERVDRHILWFQGGESIEIIGEVKIFGETKDKTRRPPYIALISYAQVSRNSTYVDAVRAYLHPIVSSERWMPVDSLHERRTANTLIAGMRTCKKSGLTVKLTKPLFDMNPDLTEDAEVLLPDFIFDVEGGLLPEPERHIFEVMGYPDDWYVDDKRKIIDLMEAYCLGRVTEVLAHTRPKDAPPGSPWDRKFLREKLYVPLGIAQDNPLANG